MTFNHNQILIDETTYSNRYFTQNSRLIQRKSYNFEYPQFVFSASCLQRGFRNQSIYLGFPDPLLSNLAHMPSPSRSVSTH